MESKLDEAAIEKRGQEIFEDCLFKSENNEDTSNAVEVQAFDLTVGFHPGRLESYKKEIEVMIDELPKSWPSINIQHFGGVNRDFEEMYLLGIAIGKLAPQLVLTIGKGILS